MEEPSHSSILSGIKIIIREIRRRAGLRLFDPVGDSLNLTQDWQIRGTGYHCCLAQDISDMEIWGMVTERNF
jgi:hypothetical protein